MAHERPPTKFKVSRQRPLEEKDERIGKEKVKEGERERKREHKIWHQKETELISGERVFLLEESVKEYALFLQKLAHKINWKRENDGRILLRGNAG